MEVAARAFSTLRPKRSKVSALPPSRAKGAPFSGLVLAATGSPRSPTAAGTPAAFLTAAQRLRRRFLFDPTVDDAHSTVQNEHNDHKRICSLMRRLVERHLLLIKLLLNRQTLSSESPINIKENARHTAHNFASCTPRKRPPSPPLSSRSMCCRPPSLVKPLCCQTIVYISSLPRLLLDTVWPCPASR